MCSIHDDDLAAANVVQRSRALYAEIPARPIDDPAGAYIGLARGKVPANEAARAEPDAASRPLVAPPRPGPRFHVEDARAPGKLAAEARAKGLIESCLSGSHP